MTQTHLKHAVTKMCVYVCVTVSRAVMSKQGLDWLILPGATRLLFHEHHTQTVRVAITSFSFSFVSLYMQPLKVSAAKYLTWLWFKNTDPE